MLITKKTSILVLPALIILCVLGLAAKSSAESVSEILQSSFDKDVLASKKPVVVDFFATWCGPCKRLAPVIDELSKSYAGKATFVRIDVDKNQELAKKFNISGIPAVFIFKNGKVEDTSVGLVPAETLTKKIDSAIASK
jgi:thioredoxin 1